MLNTDCLETRRDLSPWRSASKTASKCPGSLGGFEWKSKSNSSYAPPEWTAVNGWICHSPSPLGCESPAVVFSTWFYTCLPSMKRWWTIRRYPRGPHTRFSRISRRIPAGRLQEIAKAPYSTIFLICNTNLDKHWILQMKMCGSCTLFHDMLSVYLCLPMSTFIQKPSGSALGLIENEISMSSSLAQRTRLSRNSSMGNCNLQQRHSRNGAWELRQVPWYCKNVATLWGKCWSGTVSSGATRRPAACAPAECLFCSLWAFNFIS